MNLYMKIHNLIIYIICFITWINCLMHIIFGLLILLFSDENNSEWIYVVMHILCSWFGIIIDLTLQQNRNTSLISERIIMFLYNIIPMVIAHRSEIYTELIYSYISFGMIIFLLIIQFVHQLNEKCNINRDYWNNWDASHFDRTIQNNINRAPNIDVDVRLEENNDNATNNNEAINGNFTVNENIHRNTPNINTNRNNINIELRNIINDIYSSTNPLSPVSPISPYSPNEPLERNSNIRIGLLSNNRDYTQ